MEFPVLYKYTSSGQPQQWQIFVEGNSYFTEEGIVNGVITKSLPTICTPKNLGKSNETTGEQQALLEANAKQKKKLEKHYNIVLQEERSFYEPMLAHDVEKYKSLLFTVDTYIQPKLDGVRCISQNNKLMSRNGKPWLTCPHLHQNEVILDGELYNHNYHDNFNELISLIKRIKPTPEDIESAKKNVKLYVYDFPEYEGKFSDRMKAFDKWMEKTGDGMEGITPVTAYKVNSWEDIQKMHEKFISEGYEGSIIRLDLGNYEHKRSKQLLKYKDWKEDEYKIVEILEGEGNKVGMVGSITCKLPNGKTFNSNMKGSFEYSKEVFDNKKNYVGKTATVKYQNLTPDGVPRFPYVIKINRESYE